MMLITLMAIKGWQIVVASAPSPEQHSNGCELVFRKCSI
jgi:hypothetical protein